jgi:hypothetical protein
MFIFLFSLIAIVWLFCLFKFINSDATEKSSYEKFADEVDKLLRSDKK